MRGLLVAVAVAVLVSTAGAAAAPTPTIAWSGQTLRIPAPRPGEVSLGVVKIRARAPAKAAKTTIAGLAGHPGLVVLTVSRVARARGLATRTVLFAVVNENTRRLAGDPYASLDLAVHLLFTENEPPPKPVSDAELLQETYRRASEVIHAEEVKRWQAEDAVRAFDALYRAPARWTPAAGESAALDTGYYDDGHAFGWKPASTQLAKDLIHLETRGDDWVDGIDKLLGDLKTFGPPAPAPSPQPTYTCSGPNTLLFDNWNTSPVANGGTAATFDTGGKAYCINETATYHWNGGAGSAPGTISIAQAGKTLATWQAVGQAPDGSPGTINWVANIPAGSPPVVVRGTFTCRDSSAATWGQNAASKHVGFCRVWGQVATPS